MSTTHVFVSFDIEHDKELFEQLSAQAKAASLGFTVSGGSERSMKTDTMNDRVRRRVREADQMIILCGEHTGSSTSVSAELRIAQEERTPYFLLWGRREAMCTKPVGAKPAEGMFSWTRQILQDQILLAHRKAEADATADAVRAASKKSGSKPPAVAP